MAEVPYQPYPDVQPAERVLRPGGVPEVPEAFGVGVARAIQTFGGNVKEAAGDVFQGALNLRRLQIEGKLRDLTTDYYNEAAPIQNDFLKQQGENASQDAMNAQLAKLNQVKQKYAGLAGQYGVYGANAFGAEASAMERNFTREAIQHSSRQSILAQDASINSRIATINDQMRKGTISQDEGEKQLIAAERDRGSVYGSPANVVTQNTYDKISEGTRERVKGAILRNPEQGAALAQQVQNSGKLNGKDSDDVEKSAQQALYSSGPHQWLTRVMSGENTTLGDKKVSIDRLENAIWANEGRTRGPLVRSGKYAGQQALPGGVMPGNLAPWLKEAGMPPMTEAEYAANPAAQHQLMRFKLNQFQEQTGSANGAASMWFTGKPLEQAGFQTGDGYHTNRWYITNFNQALAHSASQNEIASAAEAHGNSLANTIAPDAGEHYREYAQQRFDTQRRMDDFARYDTRTKINEWIINNPGKSYPDFTSDPQMQGVLEQAKQTDSAYALRIPSMINTYNNSLRDHTDQNHLRDLYASYTEGDPKFMEQNPWEDKQLSMADKVKIARLQGEFHRNGVPDPNFTRAYNDLAAMFKSEIPDKTNDPDGYKEYKGNLYIAMQAYQEANKQPLKIGTPEGNKALAEIHQMLMQKQASGYRVYEEINVPKPWHDAYLQKNPDATEGQIQYDYFKHQAIDQFRRLAEEKGQREAFKAGQFAPGRGGVLGRVGQVPPPPPPPPPAQPWYTTAPTRPRFAGQPPARVDIAEPWRRAAGIPSPLPVEPPVTAEQEAAIGAAYGRPEPTAPNIRAQRIREAHEPKTQSAENK